jgi:hypothetical protein
MSIKDHQDRKLRSTNKFTFLQNYPNLFNSGTVIKYELLTSGHIELAIYDLLGRHIRTLSVSYQQVGRF